MKVLYIAGKYDPRDHDSGSGVDYMIYQSLKQKGIDLTLAGPFDKPWTLIEELYFLVHTIISSKGPVKYPRSYLKDASRQVDRAIRDVDPDVIFTKHAASLSYCPIEKPLVYLIDSTLVGYRSQWGNFTDSAYKSMLAWETRVVQASREVITNSDWSASILADDYHVDKSRITVYANPSSIPQDVVPENLELDTKDFDPIKLLLVGRAYRRKGIDIAIETVQQLNASGHPAELRIVGMDGEDKPHVRYMGYYKKTIREELIGYVENYSWANFLIHPARFEAAGIVPGEAAAFGVPTITNNAGGLGTTVKDGVSGIVLPIGSSADLYVEAILRLVNNPEDYIKLCISSRNRYESELNWDHASDVIIDALKRAARVS